MKTPEAVAYRQALEDLLALVRSGSLIIAHEDRRSTYADIIRYSELVACGKRVLTTDWVPERSSGYDGYRNTVTGDWRYAEEFTD